jgi:hypothetical protein
MHPKSCSTCFYFDKDKDRTWRGKCKLHNCEVTDSHYQSCVSKWISKKRIENLDNLIR